MTWKITDSQRREDLIVAVLRDRRTCPATQMERIRTIMGRTPPPRARDMIRRGTPYVGVLIDNWRDGRADLEREGYLLEDHLGRMGITPDLKPFRAFTAAHPTDACMIAGHVFERVDVLGWRTDPHVQTAALARVRQ